MHAEKLKKHDKHKKTGKTDIADRIGQDKVA
jgi:hypothetical protein